MNWKMKNGARRERATYMSDRTRRHATTCAAIDTEFLLRSRPASNRTSAGSMKRTRTNEMSIQVVSPGSTAHVEEVRMVKGLKTENARGAAGCTRQQSSAGLPPAAAPPRPCQWGARRRAAVRRFKSHSFQKSSSLSHRYHPWPPCLSKESARWGVSWMLSHMATRQMCETSSGFLGSVSYLLLSFAVVVCICCCCFCLFVLYLAAHDSDPAVHSPVPDTTTLSLS
jgi:hypothetical protein